MDEQTISRICDERLGRWAKLLCAKHATPVVVIGVGHNTVSGEIVVLTPEEMDDFELGLFLKEAVRQVI